MSKPTKLDYQYAWRCYSVAISTKLYGEKKIEAFAKILKNARVAEKDRYFKKL